MNKDIFACHGLDPADHSDLVTDLALIALELSDRTMLPDAYLIRL